VYAPPGQEEAQVQTAAELAAGDSYDYGGDGSDVSNPYLGVASNETINQLQNAVKNAYSRGEGFSPVLTFDQFNALKGTTLANPFRTDPSRGGIASFLARKLDYRGQRDTLDDLQRQYAMFVNPTGQIIDVPTINSLKLDNASTTALLKDQKRLLERPSDQGDGSEGKLRAGLQTEYGTLFGSPVGTPTVFGDVKAQVPPMSPGEMAARIGAAATPVGLFTSLGGQKEFTTERSMTYDPRLDPNSELYEGPKGGILGTFLDTITGGAGTSALKQGSDFLKSSEGGFNLKDLVSGIFSSNQGQKAQEEMKNTEDQTGKNVLQDSSVSLMEPGANLASSFNTSRTRYGDLPTTIKEGDRNITNPNIALAIGIMNKEPGVDFSQAYLRAQMEMAKRKKFGIK
tara:strand:- start:576 stop:1772 length:1197 start_codon:yes stop_codon:yes gene_type:complete